MGASYICTRVGSSRKDPGPCGFGGFPQPLSDDLLEFGLQVKVCLAALDRYEKFGQVQGPFTGEQVDDQVWSSVV